jgi:hypothetical protein
VENVENLSTIFVDKSRANLETVEYVENLSTENVENQRFMSIVWKVWKTYPQGMWKTGLKNHFS